MSELTIGLLDAEVADPRHTDPQRVDRLLRQVAHTTLDDRRTGQHDLAGEWCVRRIDLELRLDPGEPDTAAAARWADQIAHAVGGLVADGRDVIHYPHRALAVADAVRSAAAGNGERAWAWRRLGVLGPHDPEPATDARGTLLAVLARDPRTAVAALAETAARDGLSGLDRLLGEAGWWAAAEVVAPAATLRAALAAVGSPASGATAGTSGRAAGSVGAGSAGGGGPTAGTPAAGDAHDVAGGGVDVSRVDASRVDASRVDVSGAAARARARAVIASSQLLGAAWNAVVDGRIVPTAAVVAAWAVLGTVEVEPHRPATAPAVAAELALAGAAGTERAAVAAGRPARPAVDPAAASPGPPPAVVRRAGLGPAEDRPVETAPADGAAVGGRAEGATAWAGLVFLLNSAAGARLPQALDEDVRLAARPLSWVVHRLGQRIVPVPATDPAVLALAGLAPDAPLPAGDEPSRDEETALVGHADRWAAVTLAALVGAAPGETAPVGTAPVGTAAGDAGFGSATAAPTLWDMARRPGRILADPGWLEVHLALDTVDVAVRRAGLDVDPGWVDWLGAVVRICYG